MPDAFEEQAVLVAAEQAAAEGDAVAAEGHLRKLLELQTARLGPDHGEVASTLHNLAVVCERAGRIGEAEGLYRRAYTVAAAALPPTDQLVVRCQEDLNAFLEARLMPLPAMSTPSAAPHAASRGTPPSGVRKASPAPAARSAARPASRVRAAAPPPPPAATARGWMAVTVGGALLVAAAIAWAMFGRSPAPPTPTAESSASTAPAKPPAPAPAKKAVVPPPPQPTPAAATPASPATTDAPAAPRPAVEPATPAPREPAARDASANPAAITVTDARICRQLSTAGGWSCTPPEQPIAAGRLYFLTRLEVPRAMQIEHRWD